MEKITDVPKPKIGKYYLVPCVQTFKLGGGFTPCEWLPILGDVHEDREIIGFQAEHAHPDWRFVRDSTVKARLSLYYHIPEITRRDQPRAALMAIVFTQERTAIHTVEWKPKRMMRQHPTFPVVKWSKELEAKYAHTNAKCGVCPHRGMPLDGAPVRDGARVCPGHGLAWDVTTGALKPRAR